MDLNLCISNGTVSTKIYDKRDDFDFDIVNFPFLDGDVPWRTSYGVYISRLIRFTRASSNLNDFSYRNKALTAILLRKGYRYFKLCKAFLKFYRRHSALLEKYSVSLKTLLQQGILEPEFYGDLVYRFRKIVGKSNFLEQFRKLINRYKRTGYSLGIMRQTACLVVNPIIVDGYASLFNCTTAVRASDSMTASFLKLLFVCVEFLWPSQPNGVMSSVVSLPNHTFTGQALSSKRLTSIVHILSPETDNCPS